MVSWLLAAALHLSKDPIQEGAISRRVNAHILLGDYSAAKAEAIQALNAFPYSSNVYEAYIRTLAQLGDEKQLISTWNEYTKRFPEKACNRNLIEEMAWGILSKAAKSSSIIMRHMSLLAAFLSQDAKGVHLLQMGMKDSNYSIRAMSVELSAHFHDQKLIDEVVRLFEHETNSLVREKVIEAVGKMKIVSLRPKLEALIANEKVSQDERALAISAQVVLLEGLNKEDTKKLCASKSSGLRQLACKSIAYFQDTSHLEEVLKLTVDNNPHVRMEAFQSLGQIYMLFPAHQRTPFVDVANVGIHDANQKAALSALWLLTLLEPGETKTFFDVFLNDTSKETRAIAAAVLGATGTYGREIIDVHFKNHPDSIVRLNLALALIGQRHHTEAAAAFISQMLLNEKENLRWKKVGIFQAITNKPAHRQSETPEITNKLLRLELLHLLAILKIPNSQAFIHQALMERSWEIAGTASVLLLTEGDESAIEPVKQLLHSSEMKVRLQAALMISLWSRDESAIKILEECYPQVSSDHKARILEGMGRIGSMKSVPFLLNVFKEPSQTLRLIAALAIIQCLNH